MLDNTTTVRGETVDGAISKGLQTLGITKDEADIHIISEGKKGLFGFGKQDAIVEVRRKTELSLSEITDHLEEKAEQENQDTVTSAKEDTQVASKDTSNESTDTEVEKEETPTSQAAESIEEDTQVDTNIADEAEAETDEEVEETDEVDEADDAIRYQEATKAVAEYLETVIANYGAQATVTPEMSKNQVVFYIETEKTGLIIGKHGKIINSLQTLAQVLFQSLYRRRISVLLNIGDYRDRRATVLEQMGERAAKRAMQTGRPVSLDPLPAYERKQIHAFLAKNYPVKTYSQGKEPHRYLVVEAK